MLPLLAAVIHPVTPGAKIVQAEILQTAWIMGVACLAPMAAIFIAQLLETVRARRGRSR